LAIYKQWGPLGQEEITPYGEAIWSEADYYDPSAIRGFLGSDFEQTRYFSGADPGEGWSYMGTHPTQGKLWGYNTPTTVAPMETEDIEIPSDVYPFAQSGLPYDRIGEFADLTKGFLTGEPFKAESLTGDVRGEFPTEKLMEQQATIRNALMGTWDKAFGSRLSPQLGKLGPVGMLGGTAQERITSDALATLAGEYDKYAMESALKRETGFLGAEMARRAKLEELRLADITERGKLAGGLLTGSYYYADPLAPYTLWTKLVSPWLGG